MEKVVDGVELLRMIRDGEIKNGTRLLRERGCMYIFNDGKIALDEEVYGFKEGTNIFYIDKLECLLKSKFKIFLKEDKKIDIDSIEEVKHIYIYNLDPNVEKVDDRVSTNVEKINELIKAVKQLNKKLEEK
jgi:cystathionine beta-lyase family protein involved in aluminum resistance